MSKPLRVLIVEDSEDDTELLLRELRRSGYGLTHERVETAPTMRAALARQPWDLVIADYSMPQFSAPEALLILKESGFDLPFIIVSGTIGEERAVAAMKTGAHDYLVKGHFARLVPVIERELREAQIRWERRQAETALQDRERYFRALIENTSDVIATLDAAGRITYVSPALIRALGYAPEEYIGLNGFDLVHPDDVHASSESFIRLLQQPDAGNVVQFGAQHKNGSLRWLEATSRNLLHEPAVGAIVISLRDITERKHLEAQLLQAQKMEAIGQLTAGIAHDFNNLLTAINGFAELMQMSLPSADPLRPMADKVFGAGQRAANLVRQLLTFSRKQIVALKIIELNAIVAGMEKMLGRIIGEHIQMSTNLAPGLWFVKADPSQMEQIIVNLAVNARDAMPWGGKLVIETANVVLDKAFAAAHPEAQPGPYVQLTVSDTGGGMSEEVKAHLFEPFFTTKEPGKGTGLGLATVYGIVKQCEGCIWVSSELGQGSSFKIYLPRAQSDELPPASPTFPTTRSTGVETILLTEDADEVRDLVRRVLEELGYTVLVAPDGLAAVQLANNYRDPIHLLLTDMVMPGLGGKNLAEQLVQTRPELKVIFMSGYADETIAHQGVLASHVFLLQKPFSPLELAQKVRQVLDEAENATE